MIALWDDDGITSWFFSRGSVPDDIDSGKPQPSGWGKPTASFPASTCKPSTYFYDHIAIFDTTLWYASLLIVTRHLFVDKFALHSGDWGGGVWSAAGVPGQEQSCAQRTGVAACEDYVRAHGSAFAEACEYPFRSLPVHYPCSLTIHDRLGSQEPQDLPEELNDDLATSLPLTE